MAIMAKKSKKVKTGLEVNAEVAVVEENADIESEPVSKKKKKKSEKNKGASDSVNESMDTSVVESFSEDRTLESKLEDIAELPVKLTKKERKEQWKLKNLANSSIIENGDGDPVKKDNHKSNARISKNRLKADHDFVGSLLAAMHIPNHKRDEDGDEFEDVEDEGETKEEKEKRVKPGGTSRAATSQELRDRLQAKLEELRGRKLGADESKTQRKLKKKLASIEKKKKNDEELKQKLMAIGKNTSNLNKVLNNEVEPLVAKVTKPGVKTEKGVVFSKFDFKDDMAPKEVKKGMTPQGALNKIKKNKEKIKLWEDKGKTEKAKNIENSIAWDNALGKAQGEKVKDDVFLLKKSIKKQKQIKSSSKKKWDARAEGVKNKETAFVEKREGNMAKRKKEKMEKKMKTLVARGRHVPGS